jgi:hypothetical protein
MKKKRKLLKLIELETFWIPRTLNIITVFYPILPHLNLRFPLIERRFHMLNFIFIFTKDQRI